MEVKEQNELKEPDTEVKPHVKRPRIHPIRSLRLVIFGVLLCAIVGLICYFAGRSSGSAIQPHTELDAVVLENRLSEISEFSSVSWVYTNMAQFESSNEFYGMVLPFTTKKFILTYDGQIKAGMDLQKADVSVSGKTVTIQLPESEILSHEINEDSVEVFNETTSIFNPFTVEDFAAFQSDQKKAMEEKAVKNGLLSKADSQAAESIRLFLESIVPEGYTLSITCSI